MYVSPNIPECFSMQNNGMPNKAMHVHINFYIYTAPGDYIGFSGNVIGALEPVNVTIVDDNICENSAESFTISLAPVFQDSRVTINISVATVFIEDNGEYTIIYYLLNYWFPRYQ